MKICAYVQDEFAKKGAYKNECMDQRQYIGLRVIMDALRRIGYEVEWAGMATVHLYDVVLVSLTADCDWWPFIRERLQWRKGSYKTIVGGAGVLHVTPFLRFADYFSLGRGEQTVPELIKYLDGKGGGIDDSIIRADAFNPDSTYMIRQAETLYPHEIQLTDTKTYKETAIGCNHKCLFCGYTWQRRFQSNKEFYSIGSGLFDTSNTELAMLDMTRSIGQIDWSHLRTTAIDGFSERLRYMVNKRISREMMRDFIVAMIESDAKPHQIKFFNICGYPTETDDDMREYLETIREADETARGANDKQWSIVLSSTHFRPMPATPLACAPMSKRNYRRYVSRLLGRGLCGNLIYQGRRLWSVEGMGTESLAPVMLSAIAHRGSENDSESIIRICRSAKFWNAAGASREAVLTRLFDMDTLFGEFTPQTLPSRYLRTYCAVEKTWARRPWAELG